MEREMQMNKKGKMGSGEILHDFFSSENNNIMCSSASHHIVADHRIIIEHGISRRNRFYTLHNQVARLSEVGAPMDIKSNRLLLFFWTTTHHQRAARCS